MRAAKLLFTAYALITLVGCSVYDKALLNKQADNCPPGTIGCWPSRPADVTVDSGPDQTAVFALNAIVLNQNPTTPDGGVGDGGTADAGVTGRSWRDIGFNLDGINTTPTNSSHPGCLPPSMTDAPPVDGTNGIDNVFGSKLWPAFATLFAQFEDNLCCYMQKGRGTLLLRITGWNGTPNDAHVTASLLNTTDGTTDTNVHWDPTTQSLLRADNSPATPPSWDPNKTHWYVDPATFVGTLDSANQIDTLAYIVDNYLVMALNTSPLQLFLGSNADIQMGLVDGHLVAKISADGTHIEEGTFGGRMGYNGLVAASAGLIGGCTGASNTVDLLLPMFADVRSDGVNDETQNCDAVSVGVPFKAVRALDAQPTPNTGYLCYPLAHCPGGVTSCDPTPGRVPEQCDPANCVSAPGICTGVGTSEPANDCDHATWD